MWLRPHDAVHRKPDSAKRWSGFSCSPGAESITVVHEDRGKPPARVKVKASVRLRRNKGVLLLNRAPQAVDIESFNAPTYTGHGLNFGGHRPE